MLNQVEDATQVQTIHVEPGKKFLSEVFTDGYLPYGILNKGKTGCGGTTVAIESPYNYIIFVPTIELILNKVAQYVKNDEINILSVYGDVDKEYFTDYLNEQNHYEYPIKILATYNAAPKVLEHLGQDTFYNGCLVLVDEVQATLTEYGYRADAIENLLNVLTDHQRVTYMTATPIAPADGLIQLEHLPRNDVVWLEKNPMHVMITDSTSPTCAVIEMIYTLYNDVSAFSEENGKTYDPPEQFFFYINSVKLIKAVLNNLPERIRNEINIVCADKTENLKKLGDFAELIGSTLELKKFNLLTKKAFLGCDIYSPSGVSIIVTDVHYGTNFLDPYIDALQIHGRIRNEENPFRDYVIHITNSNLSKKSGTRTIKVKNGTKENTSRYINYCQKVQKAYECICNSYKMNGQDAEIYKKIFNIRKSCTLDKRKCIEYMYNTLSSGGSEADLYPIEKLLLEQHPEINDFIKRFTWEKLKAVSFKLEKIQKLVHENSEIKCPIAKELKPLIKVGSEYSVKDLKDILTKIYADLGLKKKAPATHIKEYFDVKEFTKGKKGEKNTKSYRIISEKPGIFDTENEG